MAWMSGAKTFGSMMLKFRTGMNGKVGIRLDDGVNILTSRLTIGAFRLSSVTVKVHQCLVCRLRSGTSILMSILFIESLKKHPN